MFPKREPQEGEVYCPYDGIAYSKVPGYISGYGCPVCGGIGQYHLPVQKSAKQSVQRTVEACPVSHQSFLDDDENTYLFCPYCGERLHSR